MKRLRKNLNYPGHTAGDICPQMNGRRQRKPVMVNQG